MQAYPNPLTSTSQSLARVLQRRGSADEARDMASDRGEQRRSEGDYRRRTISAGHSDADTPAQRALDRIVRSGQPASALRLFLSRLTALRSHHQRIARCLFDETVRQHGGQIFSCADGDLVLLARSDCVASLALCLNGLFRADAPDSEPLMDTWCLPEESADARAALGGHTAVAPLVGAEPPLPTGALATIDSVLTSSDWLSLVRRQHAIRFDGRTIQVLFRELSVSVDALEARIGFRIPDSNDPYLARYVSGQMDERMLISLASQDLSGVVALNVNVPLERASSLGFVTLRAAARRAGTLLAAELHFVDVAANPPLYDEIRTRLQEDGCTIVVDGLDHMGMLLFDVSALQADLVKLRWSPLIPGLAARERRELARAIELIGPRRIVLYQAETERALLWGRSMGIDSFQGRHVDAMLAADRIMACPTAHGCTLRQCIGRAAANEPKGRAGCGTLILLEGTLPTRLAH